MSQRNETAKEQTPTQPIATPAEANPLTFDQWIQNGVDHFNALQRADAERD